MPSARRRAERGRARSRAPRRRARSPRLRAQVTYHLLKCIFQHAHLTKGGAGGAGGAAARPARSGAPRLAAPPRTISCAVHVRGVQCRRSPPAWSSRRACGARRSQCCGPLRPRSNSPSRGCRAPCWLAVVRLERGTHEVPAARAHLNAAPEYTSMLRPSTCRRPRRASRAARTRAGAAAAAQQRSATTASRACSATWRPSSSGQTLPPARACTTTRRARRAGPVLPCLLCPCVPAVASSRSCCVDCVHM